MAWVLLACGGSGTESERTAALTATPAATDEAALRALVEQQLQFAKDGDWPGLYATYAPDAQAGCSQDQFVAEREALAKGGFDAAKVSQTITSIRGDGDEAYITWSIAYAGTPVAASDEAPDAYVRIDGRWYDAPDAHTGCARRADATGTPSPDTTTAASPVQTPIP